jgi:signal transduction histidine kinase
MPKLDATDALDIFNRHDLDIPFIIVSGSVEEEFVVRAMKNGAHDFFSKNRLTLLAPAVDRELREAGVRRERAQLQEQLMISDRMASVGILAAGVAHEINNPLAVAVGNLDLALQHLEILARAHGEISELHNIVTEVRESHEAVERIRNVASDLRLFARSDNEIRAAVDIQSVIESSLRMAQNEIRHRAKLRTEFAPVPPVAGNESKIGQVFLNLIVNAAQSITEGSIEDNEISVSTALAPDGCVVVSVRDTGSGMSAEVKRKLFSPFFTTKPVGIGTGLGLSICQRIINEIGGTITVESEVGRGTEFKVQLQPATENSERVSAPTIVVESSSRRGAILVIAEEALEWIAQGMRYDIIFCDLMMPGTTGMEFHSRLVQVDPDQASNVIFLTGGAFTSQARQFLEDVDNLCIDKPFDNLDLLTLVNNRLSR